MPFDSFLGKQKAGHMDFSLSMQPASIARPYRLFGEGSYTVFLFSSMTTTPSPFLRTMALFPRLRIASMAATASPSTFTIKYTPPFVDQSSQFLFYYANNLTFIVFNRIFQKVVRLHALCALMHIYRIPYIRANIYSLLSLRFFWHRAAIRAG